MKRALIIIGAFCMLATVLSCNWLFETENGEQEKVEEKTVIESVEEAIKIVEKEGGYVGTYKGLILQVDDLKLLDLCNFFTEEKTELYNYEGSVAIIHDTYREKYFVVAVCKSGMGGYWYDGMFYGEVLEYVNNK